MIKNSTYKQTSIGLIPSDWKVDKLGNIVDKKRPITYGIVQTGELVENGVKCLRVVDIIEGKINSAKLITTSAEISNGYKRTLLVEGDLVIALRGKIGELAVITKDLVGVNLTRGVGLIALQNDFHNEYFRQQLISDSGRQLLKSKLNGSALQELSISVLRNIPVSIPSLQEQQKIASILSTWDLAIDNCKVIIEELQVRNNGLLNKLIIENGELKVKLGDIFIESKIPAINSNVNKRITVRLNLKGIEKRGVRGSEIEEATAYYLRKAGQFIYGKQNLHKGAFGIIPNELDGFESSSDIPAFDVNEKFNINYIFYYFSRVHFFEKLEDISTGTGSKRIQPRELYKIHIKIPSTIDKQNKIVEILDTAVKELNQYQQKLETLQLQKKGLMQQLLTGKVRVKI